MKSSYYGKASSLKFSLLSFVRKNKLKLIILAAISVLALVTGVFSAIKYLNGETAIIFSDFGLKELASGNSGTSAMSFLRKEELSARTSSAILPQRDITLLLIYGRENYVVLVALNSERMFIASTMTAARPSATSVTTSSITAMRLIAKRQDLKRKDIAIIRLFFSGKWI